ncbi:hypothetical protein [Lysobacter sp. TY2-98]|uniref:hypothetical protein n=1 Tax=Lysobacter sp. TY2-98 TaxID=2290922 RepID=UPI0013B38223|nr:hypothetical protein [Lysobacter sp. TY2-98]
MSAVSASALPHPAASADDGFSLVIGGPLYQLMRRAHMADAELHGVTRRMVVISLVAWVPLLLLSLAEGRAFSGVKLPFLHDVEAYARFLVALPLLVLAEIPVHQRVGVAVAQFRERAIVASEAWPRFDAAIASARRLRNSITAEVVLLLAVFILSPVLWTHALVLPIDTWYASITPDGISLTGAGWWMVHVSVPIFQFIVLRWWFRIAIWWIFLWRVSRLPLELRALHPDRAGGLSFLGGSVLAFAPLLFAQGVVSSGLIASRLLSGGEKLMDYRGQIAVLVIVLVAMIALPLTFFSQKLLNERRNGLRRYGALSTRYVTEFDRKWLQGGDPGEPLIGSSDIQSLADLGNASAVVNEMRPVPIDVRAIARLALVTLAPFGPLVLTVIPFGDLVQQLFRMLL